MARCPGRSRRLGPGPAAAAALIAGMVLAWPWAATAVGVDAEAQLAFARHGEPVGQYDLAWMKQRVPPRNVTVFEPYEEREVPFEAFELRRLLDVVYGEGWRNEEELLFTCRDGYQPTVPVHRVLEHEAWVAFARPGAASFEIEKVESGAKTRIDLSPFYLVWENLDDARIRQESDYGWPYQLVGIDLIDTAARFPGLAPPPGADAAVVSGFRAFRAHCSKCHPLNGEGGKIGPELNATVNPVEYRDAGWLRSWITDPASVNPGTRMPPLNPALPDRDQVVDEILAYLRAKADERAAADTGAAKSAAKK